MSTQNDNTLPKIWQIIDIVYHIVRLSETVAAIALARTCKRLYSCIISSNSLWHKLYRHNFPRDINTDIDWLEWQLEQEQRVTVATTINAKSKVESRLTWFQLYSQRVNMGINWQKNKPTSTVHLKPFSVIEIAELTNFAQTIVISYPGWFAIAALWKLQVDLIKLLPMNESKTYSLDLDKSRFKWIKNIKFYQHRHQANNSDKYMRVILHLEYVEESFNALQIWNANSCELLHSIDIYGDWDGRTINASLLFLNSKLIGLSNNPQFRCYTRLVYNIDSEKQPREYQSIILKNPINFFKNIIHTTSNDETIIIRYRNNKRKVAYQVIRVLLPPGAI
ncbi:hypothetical protein BDF19DRAFT_421608 [Syncephalis fuscata]|nr:hypothetical protein BDF19DRAFT_421608 [Syncephalis fuscata]